MKFTVNLHWVDALLTGDYAGLSLSEISKIEAFLDDVYLRMGQAKAVRAKGNIVEFVPIPKEEIWPRRMMEPMTNKVMDRVLELMQDLSMVETVGVSMAEFLASRPEKPSKSHSIRPPTSPSRQGSRRIPQAYRYIDGKRHKTGRFRLFSME